MATIQEIENQHTSGVYTKRNVVIVRGQGAHLWDSEGREYIDCVGGQGTGCVGHANPAVVKALTEQAQTLTICPELFYNDRRAMLLEKLSQITGMPRAFLCNSGAEAVEGALKFARLFTGRTEVVASMRGFHGRTMGALSATWEKKYREPFLPLIPGFTHISYNDLSALDAAVSDKTAAVILEVVQGEGGVRPGTPEFLQGAQKICNERGAMFIVDEVQTGFCRTGKMFAHQHYGLKPDLLCLAKSIAGGLPMGATMISEKLGQMPPAVHGSTFGGNPLACAASLAAIDFMLDNNLAQRAAELGTWFQGQLSQVKSPLFREVRGLGLIVGVEIKQKVAPYLQVMMEHGVLALPAGMTVLRLLPPLVISQDDLAKVVEVIAEVFSKPLGKDD